jgi:hypothetical protein
MKKVSAFAMASFTASSRPSSGSQRRGAADVSASTVSR